MKWIYSKGTRAFYDNLWLKLPNFGFLTNIFKWNFQKCNARPQKIVPTTEQASHQSCVKWQEGEGKEEREIFDLIWFF